MSFEICYAGNSNQYKVAASTPERKGDEFYDKMDALANEIKKLKTEEENIFPIEDKVEEMQELCREYFDDFDYINEGFGEIDYGDGYEEFNSDGRITVDGEQIDMGNEWKVAYEKHKSEPHELRMKLTKQDWCVIYYVQWKSAWSETIEEGEFDKEKLNWKDSMVHYGDTPIIEDIAGREHKEDSIYLLVDGESHDF